MRKLMLMAVLVGTAAVMLSGCVATPMPPVDTRVTLSPNLGTTVYVSDVRCARTPGSDYLTVQANVVNNTRSERAVQWKVIWLDGNGIEIESLLSVWNDCALQPFEIKGLSATAPSLNAADMRIYLRKMP